MKIFTFFLVGIVFGFIGFLIETTNTFLKKKRLVYVGDKFFWNIPILPIYSTGGLLIHFVIKVLYGNLWYVIILITWVVICAWEYFAGFFDDIVLKKKFWDYSNQKYNINGYICAKNSLWWLFFLCIYYHFFFKKVDLMLVGS